MNRYLITIRRTTIEHEVIELEAPNTLTATHRGQQYIDGARENTLVVRNRDDDRNSSEAEEIVKVEQRQNRRR